MNWQEVCNHPDLQNLPFKIELNETGKILMSPTKVYHSVFQGEIAALLRINRSDGKILTECAINTHKGTKVADVAWASNALFKKRRRLYIFPKRLKKFGFVINQAILNFIFLKAKL